MKTLSTLNKAFQIKENSIVKAPSDTEVTQGIFLYEKLHEKEDNMMECKFDIADAQGNLATIDDAGVKLRINKDDLLLNKYQAKLDSLIGIPLNVSIKEIDEKANTVYFRMHKKRNTIAPTVNEEIANDLAKKIPIKVYGRVAAVYPSNAWVRILDQDVIGNIKVEDWAPVFTRSLSPVCIKGEALEFEVIGKSGKTNDGKPVWRLSRKKIATNPWDNLSDLHKEDGVCLVQCVEKPLNKSYWWGLSPGAPGIEIMGNYSGVDNRITVGAWYKCRIRRINKEEQIFKVSPFRIHSVPTTAAAVDLRKLAEKVALEVAPEIKEEGTKEEKKPSKKTITKKTAIKKPAVSD